MTLRVRRSAAVIGAGALVAAALSITTVGAAQATPAEIAEIGTIVARPGTPVAATPLAIEPSQDLPIIPTLPVLQPAEAADPSARKPAARPFSQSMAALTARISSRPPTSAHPVDRLVPAASTAAKAYPRGTK